MKRRHKQSGWDLTQHLKDDEEAEAKKKKKEDEHEDEDEIAGLTLRDYECEGPD